MGRGNLENRLKITAFNGSPRGSGLKGIGGGNTHQMVESFLEGARKAGAETENILLAETDLVGKNKHCLGDLFCFLKHPGKCYKKGDMEVLTEKYFSSDIVVLASPVHADNVTPLLLTFIGRLLPALNLRYEMDGNTEYKREHDYQGCLKKPAKLLTNLVDPYKDSNKIGEYRHQTRKGPGPDLVMISNAGLPEQSHFQVIDYWVERYARNAHSKVIARIYRGMGELFDSDLSLVKLVVRKYQKKLNRAGKEIVQNREISEESYFGLHKALVPMDLYAAVVNRTSYRIENGDRLYPKKPGMFASFLDRVVNLYKRVFK